MKTKKAIKKLSIIMSVVIIAVLCMTMTAHADSELSTAYKSVIDSTYLTDSSDAAYLGYALYDIDKNGIPELIIRKGTCEADKYLSIYTESGGMAQYIGAEYTPHASVATAPNQNGLLCIQAHSSYQYAWLISLNGTTLTATDVVDKRFTPEEYIERGYYAPSELVAGSDYIEFSAMNDYSALQNAQIASVSQTASNVNTSAYNVGDIVGEVVYTDIAAYINHYPIPSYAYDGGTVIVAEDLRNYGFDVNYDDSTRSLNITPNKSVTTLNGYGVDIYRHGSSAGEKFADALYSDINVYFGGNWIPSCAINGYITVKLEDLANESLGTSFTWDNDTRSAKLWLDWAEIKGYEAMQEEYNKTDILDTVVQLGYGAPSQYSASYYLTSQKAESILEEVFGSDAVHTSTGNTAFWFSCNGENYMISRWYTDEYVTYRDIIYDEEEDEAQTTSQSSDITEETSTNSYAYSDFNGDYSGGGTSLPGDNFKIGVWHAAITGISESSLNLSFSQSESDYYITNMILYRQDNGSYYGAGNSTWGTSYITIWLETPERISLTVSGAADQTGTEYLYK